MSLIKELSNKGATVAWSNVNAHRNILALGTKDSGNAGFDDYGGELELHKIDFSSDASPTLLGKAKTNARFSTLAWSEMATKQDEYKYGLIAGGMSDGSVNVWDPAKLVSSHPNAQISSVQRHSGPVSGLMFNPHRSSSHLLASGGADAAVYIMALDRPDQPNVFVPAPPPNLTKHSAEITKCAWNTQVSHILATASADGICIIWDLRQKKPWCELRDSTRSPVADIAWKPDEGLTLVTASGDDNNPVLKLWDLRSSTSLPLATLQGHTQGILSVGWCPTDSSLLMSCAKDNRTLLWDLYSLKSVYELPSVSSSGSSDVDHTLLKNHGGIFNSIGGASSRRYQVAWSPRVPAVIASCSFDRKVQIFSMVASHNSSEKAPKWMQRRCGATFGFGGKLVKFNASKSPSQSGQSKVVKLVAIRENMELVQLSKSFEAAMSARDFRSFCEQRASVTSDPLERAVWQFMQVNFEKNAREQLLHYLGFNAEHISQEAEASLGEKNNKKFHGPVSPSSSLTDANSVFNSDTSNLSSTLEHLQITGKASPKMSKEAENLVKRALLVGNFKAAVHCCLKANNMSDALLLASCGGPELWAETQAEYFERSSADRPFLRIVKAVIKSDLGSFVMKSDLRTWRETLAIISTYAKADEFPALCETLANRLEDQGRDAASANLCYMCAQNLEKTISIWADELASTNNKKNRTVALHNFIEKVSVFSQAQPDTPLGKNVTALFASYAGILAAEGEVESASAYITGADASSMVLRDRLFHSCNGYLGKTSNAVSTPVFPFEKCNVGVSQGSNQYASKTEKVASAGHSAGRPAPSPTVTASLPPNWTQLMDPTHGIPYYCNNLTGETQWEKPVMVPSTPKPHPIGPISSLSTPAVQSPANHVDHAAVRKVVPIDPSVPRPGGVSAASFNPTPSGVSYPASTLLQKPSMEMPQKPTPQVISKPIQAPPEPAHLPTDPNALATLAGSQGREQSTICTALQQITMSLTVLSMSPAEQKMLMEGRKSVLILYSRLASLTVESDVLEKLNTLCEMMENKDHGSAMGLYKELVNSSWGSHKDWLKGFKHITTLARKL